LNIFNHHLVYKRYEKPMNVILSPSKYDDISKVNNPFHKLRVTFLKFFSGFFKAFYLKNNLFTPFLLFAFLFSQERLEVGMKATGWEFEDADGNIFTASLKCSFISDSSGST